MPKADADRMVVGQSGLLVMPRLWLEAIADEVGVSAKVSRGTVVCIRCRGKCRCRLPGLREDVWGVMEQDSEAEEWRKAREHGERVYRYLLREQKRLYG